MVKQKDPGICGKRMEKTTRGNKPEAPGERRDTKEISTKGKTIQTKQDILKQRKKILSTMGGNDTKTYNKQTPKKPNNFGRKYGSRKSITKRLNG